MQNNFFKVCDVNLYFDMKTSKVCSINKDKDCQVMIFDNLDDFITGLRDMYELHVKYLKSDTKAKSK